ncbi:hypothetical protein WJX72_000606 [[Myrmecia] bisecta]|uniref:DUF1232 domain-containing protein n=1 Tax=[Myrmecia] bisecta TaxID=41462 RepID=A0AAW1QPV0_9CHLO
MGSLRAVFAEPSDVAGGSSGQTKQAQLAQHADRPAGSKQYADVACAPTQEEVEAGVAGEPDPPEGWYATLKRHAKALKRSVLALYYATQDPDVGWLPKFLAMFALAYALSPMDLIPDFIPVLGLLDDLLLLPGLIWLAIRLIPDEAWQRAKARADTEPVRLRENWVAAALMFALWDGLAVLLAHVITRKYGNRYWRHHDWIVMLIVGGTMALVEISWIIWRLWADHAGQQVKLTAEGPLAEPLLGEGRAAEENA